MLTALLRPAKRFAAARKGVAALEFAIILPLIALVFFGLFELSMGVACRERVENLAATTSDLVAQSKQVSDTDIANIFTAANAIVYPFPANSRVVLTSLSYVDDTTGRVEWSDASVGAARTVGDDVTVPEGVIATGGTVIMSETTYVYSSPTHFVVPISVTMTNKFYSRPRRSLSVARVS
jgi:Flp pilus assembly protein TadG